MRSTVFIEMSPRAVLKLIGVGFGALLVLGVVAIFDVVAAIVGLVALIVLTLAVLKALRS